MFTNVLKNLPGIILEAKQSPFIQYDRKNIQDVIYKYIKQHNLIISDIYMFSDILPYACYCLRMVGDQV